MLPTIEEYKDSFRETTDYFKTLKLQNVPSKFDANEPYFIAGGFACVFKVKQDNQFWAFKCFLQEDKHRNERLKILSEFLQQRTENYFIKTHYYTDELWVCSQLAGDAEYPTLAMPWIEGLTLGEYVHKAAKERNTDALQTIYDEFLRLAHFLLTNDFAHGDLKHDNILVTQDQNLILIDYDGMYLPELAHISSQELGGHAYQHPKRTAQDWGKHIDDFSILVILLSLRAFIVLPSLIDDHHTENLLLTDKDLQNPMQSQTLQTLWQQNDEPLKQLFGMLINSLAQNNLRVLEIFGFVEKNKRKLMICNTITSTPEEYLSFIRNVSMNVLGKVTKLNFYTTVETLFNHYYLDFLQNVNNGEYKDNSDLKKINLSNLSETYENVDSREDQLNKVIKQGILESIKLTADSIDFLNNLTSFGIRTVYKADKVLAPVYFKLLEEALQGSSQHTISNALTDLDATGDLTKWYELLIAVATELYGENATKQFSEKEIIEKGFIFDMEWWGSIDSQWKSIFREAVKGNEYSTDFFTKITNLTQLNLAQKHLAELPNWIGNLTNLTKLDLTENKLTELSSSIGKLIHLRELYLDENYLTELPNSIGNLTNLAALSVGNNQLTKISNSIGNLTNLSDLGLSQNQLTEVPKNIGNLINLTELNLGNNKLTELLESIGNLTKLTVLNVSSNRLTEVPKNIGNLINLTELNLGNNKLTEVPKSIGNLTKLESLELWHNSISDQKIYRLLPNCKIIF